MAWVRSFPNSVFFALAMSFIVLVIIFFVFPNSQIYTALLGLSSDLYNLFIWRPHLTLPQALRINMFQMKCFVLPSPTLHLFFLFSARLFYLGKWYLHSLSFSGQAVEHFYWLLTLCHLPHHSFTLLYQLSLQNCFLDASRSPSICLSVSLFSLLQSILTGK